jgi:hypothetical protein
MPTPAKVYCLLFSSLSSFDGIMDFRADGSHVLQEF